MTNLAKSLNDVSDFYLEGNEIGPSSCTAIDESFHFLEEESRIRKFPPRYFRRGEVNIIKQFGKKEKVAPLILSYDDVVFNGRSQGVEGSRRLSRNFPEVLVALLLLVYFLLVALSLFFDVNVVPMIEDNEVARVQTLDSLDASF